MPLNSGLGFRVLLLGGFEIWNRGGQVRGFESQKVRALLAYLALHRGRAFRRDRLASMFWSDRDDETARRNLRQALYNLKATLPETGGRPLLRVDGQEVAFEPGPDCWIDVEAFERAVGSPGGVGAAGFHELVAATQHYRGDLLAGFLIKECPEFEEWLVTEQERLREAALEALRRLVAVYLERGEYRLGIQHARRLVAMDPLSEEAHRHLLRLYDLAGQRGRALAHYTDLRELLRRELGVEPLAETRAVYEAILSEALRADAAAEKPEPLGPIVPLVGRREPYRQLAACWQAVLEGGFRITLLVGEEGVGKTRLARTFLDATSVQRRVVVLTGSCLERVPQPTYAALAEAVRQALPDEADQDAPRPVLAPETRRELSFLLGETGSGAEGSTAASLVDAVADLLLALARGEGEGGATEPVVLFLDDLQWADAGTIAILEALPRRLAEAGVWILGTVDPSGLAEEHPLSGVVAAAGEQALDAIELGRLDYDAIAEVAAAIVDRSEVGMVADLLDAASEGLPLALVALVNSMWDEGELASDPSGRWSFRGSAAGWQARAREGLDRLLLGRIRRLPSSTRRLASMAAVIGQRFDTALLERAEDEHAAVVEVGLEILLERWLVRQQRDQWHPAGLESSLALWSRGARRGRFQFDHPRIRRVLYDDLNPLRRQVLHRQVAVGLEAIHRDRPAAVAEELAHHFLEAGVWDRAYHYLLASAEKALAARNPEGAAHCWNQAQRVLERLRQHAKDDAERSRWQAQEEPLARSIASLQL